MGRSRAESGAGSWRIQIADLAHRDTGTQVRWGVESIDGGQSRTEWGIPVETEFDEIARKSESAQAPCIQALAMQSKAKSRKGYQSA